MPIQHLPLARQTRSQARSQAVLTPTPRAPLDSIPAVPQLRAQLDRGPTMEGGAPSRKEGIGTRRSSSFSGLSITSLKVPGEDNDDQGRILWKRKRLKVLRLLLLLWGNIKKMTQIMANLQAASSESSITPAFKTPSMKVPECFDGTQPFKVRSFIQSCQLIFHNDLENSSQDRKKVLYAN
ncbi:hypothetical protein O181_118059 [Austropuccinia psidii MF-1]|uniref:Uncharacterized protein n=1 Tax=Austropuccinia psidii MF-1 TaxID=1389203 RepID=A0A9Q3PY40_9BASI|nr:hypothetical protein [Austropuccinia psidii MF-1]